MDYTDSLTEKEWLKAIDDDGNFEEELEEDLEKEKQKKKGRKRKNKRGEDSDEDPPMPKKRGRQSAAEIKLKKQMRKLLSIVVKYTDK